MDFATEPIDPTAADALAAQNLRLELVDTADRSAFAAWFQADARGFYGPRIAQKQLDEQLDRAAYRRTVGVWDATSVEAEVPVATIATWPTPLTVPSPTAADRVAIERDDDTYRDRATPRAAPPATAARTIDAWAISSVTVAPTHRRRGVARALLESELRTANRLGVPVAILTASEATIYGRFGFAPAAFAADLTIESRRVRWSGPQASGRLHFVGLEDLRDQGRAVYDAARAAIPGEIELDALLWESMIRVIGDSHDWAKHLRAVRYDDADGLLRGFVLYRVTEHPDDFTKHTVTVQYLSAVTDDAYAALWRYILELDLVSTVQAPLRAVDEPVIWQVGDRRAVRTAHTDHLWLRILDVVATLSARGYSAPGRIVLDVDDPLGFAHGRVLLTIDDVGVGTVESLAGDAPADAAHLGLSVNDLAALYLGGTPAATLARAGRVAELRPGSADAVDAAFRTSRAPWLSTWF